MNSPICDIWLEPWEHRKSRESNQLGNYAHKFWFKIFSERCVFTVINGSMAVWTNALIMHNLFSFSPGTILQNCSREIIGVLKATFSHVYAQFRWIRFFAKCSLAKHLVHFQYSSGTISNKTSSRKAPKKIRIVAINSPSTPPPPPPPRPPPPPTSWNGKMITCAIIFHCVLVVFKHKK